MFDRIRRGWQLMQASGRALSANRFLLVYPVFSALATLLVMATFAVPVVATRAWELFGHHGPGRALAGAVLWLFYVVMSTVAIYFNTALVGAALAYLDGRRPTLGDGLRLANSRLGTILGYAVIAATVGLVLNSLSRRGGWVQRWVASLAGVAWTLATYLVVPVLAAGGVGPIAAIKRSAQLLQQTWGEQIVGTAGIKMVTALFVLGLALLGVPSVIVAANTAGLGLALAVGALFGMALMAVVLLTSALQGIYSAALYRFATTGDAGFGFERQQLAGAFVAKPTVG
jgi:hypothetical protein